MTGIHIKPAELRATSKSLDRSVDAMHRARTHLHECAVPSGAFGHLPYLSAHLDQTYRDHVDNAMQLLDAAADGLDNVVKSLLATGDGFADLERKMAEQMKLPH